MEGACRRIGSGIEERRIRNDEDPNEFVIFRFLRMLFLHSAIWVFWGSGLDVIWHAAFNETGVLSAFLRAARCHWQRTRSSTTIYSLHFC